MKIIEALPERAIKVEIHFMQADNPAKPVMEKVIIVSEDETQRTSTAAQIRYMMSPHKSVIYSDAPELPYLEYDFVIPGDKKYVFIVRERTLKDKMQQNTTDAKGD